MPHREPRVLAGRFTRDERCKRRAHINLEDASLTSKTRVRYFCSLRKLVPLLETVTAEHDLDEVLCQWVEKCWKVGEPLLTVGDALSALHFYQPWTRRRIPHAWKLFRTWRRIEVPARAPPLTLQLVRSMAAFELQNENLEMAVMLLLSFHCLLRTGEALALCGSDVLLGKDTGIIQLRSTKTSQKFSANDALAITDVLVLEVLRSLIDIRKSQRCLETRLWNASLQLKSSATGSSFSWWPMTLNATRFGLTPSVGEGPPITSKLLTVWRPRLPVEGGEAQKWQRCISPTL